MYASVLRTGLRSDCAAASWIRPAHCFSREHIWHVGCHILPTSAPIRLTAVTDEDVSPLHSQ
jgi:hypothetical protein